MPLPTIFEDKLTVPVIAAPMFLVSDPGLVIAACKAGVVGTFPAPNVRTIEELDQWLAQITEELDAYQSVNPEKKVAPFAVNLIVHVGNDRLDEELALCEKYKVKFVITSVGNPANAVERLHESGIVVFHDVISIKHAHKAIEAGVDGLILVCAGAGGHTGTLNPFAYMSQVREFWDGPIVLSGAIGDGRAVKAAEILGADFAYMGTRFIATEEAQVKSEYKDILVDSNADDTVLTNQFSGMNANFLTKSIASVGIDPTNITPDAIQESGVFAWKDIWSGGQGIGTIHDLPSVAELVERLELEYKAV